MDRIQITTTKETAETCGYALMGCANRLSAAITSPSAGEELKKSLRQDLKAVEKIVTAFAQADIVEDASQDTDCCAGNVGTAADNDSSGTSVAKEGTSSPDGASGGFLEFQRNWGNVLAAVVKNLRVKSGIDDDFKAVAIAAVAFGVMLKTAINYDPNITVKQLDELIERSGE